MLLAVSLFVKCCRHFQLKKRLNDFKITNVVGFKEYLFHICLFSLLCINLGNFWFMLKTKIKTFVRKVKGKGKKNYFTQF